MMMAQIKYKEDIDLSIRKVLSFMTSRYFYFYVSFEGKRMVVHLLSGDI